MGISELIKQTVTIGELPYQVRKNWEGGREKHVQG